MRLLSLAVALCAIGCNHIDTRVPGVLDLRSDASDAPVDQTAPKAEARAGLDGFFYGDGAIQSGAQVTVVDRKWWLFKGLVPVTNESATEEIAAAVGDSALRNVKFGEQESWMDVALVFASAGIPFVSTTLALVLMPPLDVTMTGTHVKTPAAAPPPLPAPLAGPNAPLTGANEPAPAPLAPEGAPK
jgi:hypothetical protein